jgi:hypothetical protein
MDQHQLRSRSSSRSELVDRPPSRSVGDLHKPLISPLSSVAHASPSPSTPTPSCHSHSHPAITSTPQSNEANALSPSHYITISSPSTPRRSSSVLPSPFLHPSSPVLPTLTKMSPQVLAPPPPSHNSSLHDHPRSSSRSEVLLRETLRRDRAASISPRSRIPRTESRPGRIASTSSEMFHCACTDSDDEGNLGYDNPLHVSLLFANLPKHQQNHAPPLQRASKSSADVQTLARRESDLREKDPIQTVFHLKLPHSSHPVPQSHLESYLCGTAIAQAHDRHPDRDSTSSSPEVSIRFACPFPTFPWTSFYGFIPVHLVHSFRLFSRTIFRIHCYLSEVALRMLTWITSHSSHRLSHPLHHLIVRRYRHHRHLHRLTTLRSRKHPRASQTPADVRGIIPTRRLLCPCLYTLTNPHTHSHGLMGRGNKQHRRQHHRRSTHEVLQLSCVPLTAMYLSPMSRGLVGHPVWTKIRRPKTTGAVGGGRGAHTRVARVLAPHDLLPSPLGSRARLCYHGFLLFFLVIPLHIYTDIYIHTSYSYARTYVEKWF